MPLEDWQKQQIERNKEAEEIARKLANMVNCFGKHEDMQVLVDTLLLQHKTLQQSLFTHLFLKFIEAVVNLEDWRVDGRNEAMKKTCDMIYKALLDNDMAYKEGDRKRIAELPLV